MNKLKNILGWFYGKKAPKPENVILVKVTSQEYCQSHVLQQRMKERNLTHGQLVEADLCPVRINEHLSGSRIIYFCPLQLVDVKKNISDGDGGSLPAEVVFNGLKFPEKANSGLYTLKNVQLYSNGTLQVIATERTEWIEI